MPLATVTVVALVCRRGGDERQQQDPSTMAVAGIGYSTSWTLIRRPFRSKYTVPSTRENSV